MEKLSEEARLARNAYYREWRRKNPDKVRAANKKYLEKQKSERQPTNDERFIQIDCGLLSDETFRSMKYSSCITYICMIAESDDCPEFEFPRAIVTKRYGLTPSIFQASISELIEKGFIEKSFSGKATRKPNRYRFSSAWKNK